MNPAATANHILQSFEAVQKVSLQAKVCVETVIVIHHKEHHNSLHSLTKKLNNLKLFVQLQQRKRYLEMSAK